MPKYISDVVNNVVNDVQIIAGWTFLVLENNKQSSKLVRVSGGVHEVYPRISCQKLSKDQMSLMESIVLEYRKKFNTITKEKAGDIIIFNSSMTACVFYIQMKEMGLDVEFTPLI